MIKDEISFFQNFKKDLEDYLENHSGYSQMEIAFKLNTNPTTIKSICQMTYKQTLKTCMRIYFAIGKTLHIPNSGVYFDTINKNKIDLKYKEIRKFLVELIKKEMNMKNFDEYEMSKRLDIPNLAFHFIITDGYEIDMRVSTAFKILNYFNYKIVIENINEENELNSYLQEQV